jgi:hypothetical protein
MRATGPSIALGTGLSIFGETVTGRTMILTARHMKDIIEEIIRTAATEPIGTGED